MVAYSEPGWLPRRGPGRGRAVPGVRIWAIGWPQGRPRRAGGRGRYRLTAFSTAGRRWHGAVARLPDAGRAFRWTRRDDPDDEALTDARRVRNRALLATLLVMLGRAALTYLTARLVSRPIRALADETAAIRSFDFTADVATRSVVREVDDYGRRSGLDEGRSAASSTSRRTMARSRTSTACCPGWWTRLWR